jgi:hypothetical protein
MGGHLAPPSLAVRQARAASCLSFDSSLDARYPWPQWCMLGQVNEVADLHSFRTSQSSTEILEM